MVNPNAASGRARERLTVRLFAVLRHLFEAPTGRHRNPCVRSTRFRESDSGALSQSEARLPRDIVIMVRPTQRRHGGRTMPWRGPQPGRVIWAFGRFSETMTRPCGKTVQILAPAFRTSARKALVTVLISNGAPRVRQRIRRHRDCPRRPLAPRRDRHQRAGPSRCAHCWTGSRASWRRSIRGSATVAQT